MGRFFSEIFQDVDGGFSMKRVIAFAFLVTIVAIVIYVSHFGIAVPARVAAGAAPLPAGSVQPMAYAIPEKTLNFLQDALTKLLDGLKWIVGMILAEHAPQLVASAKGTGDTAKSTS